MLPHGIFSTGNSGLQITRNLLSLCTGSAPQIFPEFSLCQTAWHIRTGQAVPAFCLNPLSQFRRNLPQIFSPVCQLFQA